MAGSKWIYLSSCVALYSHATELACVSEYLYLVWILWFSMQEPVVCIMCLGMRVQVNWEHNTILISQYDVDILYTIWAQAPKIGYIICHLSHETRCIVGPVQAPYDTRPPDGTWVNKNVEPQKIYIKGDIVRCYAHVKTALGKNTCLKELGRAYCQ